MGDDTGRPHVMHLLASFEVGGAECVALDLAQAMGGRGFDVSASALYGNGQMSARFAAAGIGAESVVADRERPGFDPAVLWGLVRLLRREHPDILHCHNRRTHVYGVMAAKASRVPVVVCTQHGLRSSSKDGVASAGERLAAAFASHHIAVCEAVLRKQGFPSLVRANRVSVIHNGVDTAHFIWERPLRPCRRGKRVLGYVGRLSAEKGHVVLLEALRDLVDGGADVEVRLVGDGPARGQLEQAVRDLGIADRVCFLGTRDDVPDLLRSFDIFVLPSLTEGLPLTVIEAMASGLPVVATNVGGVPELVRHGETGLLVRPGSPDGLAGAIARLLEDPMLCHRMGRLGQRVAVERFDLELMARRHAQLYRAVIAQKRR